MSALIGVRARAMRLGTADWQPGTLPFALRHATDDLLVTGADDWHLDLYAVLGLQDPGTDPELVLVAAMLRRMVARTPVTAG